MVHSVNKLTSRGMHSKTELAYTVSIGLLQGHRYYSLTHDTHS